MANIGTVIFTTLFGTKVGSDEFGNKYYKSSKFAGKHIGRYNKERRWVIFNGKAEASKIPPYWHGWMHYTHESPMTTEESKRYFWQKTHTPNLTGTKYAYMPPGHILKGGERDRAISDYEAWKP